MNMFAGDRKSKHDCEQLEELSNQHPKSKQFVVYPSLPRVIQRHVRAIFVSGHFLTLSVIEAAAQPPG